MKHRVESGQVGRESGEGVFIRVKLNIGVLGVERAMNL